MKHSKFRIKPLESDVAEKARAMAAEGADDHARVIADSQGGFPCRHCLRYARVGEEMILFPYTAIPSGHPYCETGPIFVHKDPCERYSATDEFPAEFRKGRVLRAYDCNYNMIAAEIVNNGDAGAVIEKLLQKPETAFVDARSLTHGCYSFRIERL